MAMGDMANTMEENQVKWRTVPITRRMGIMSANTEKKSASKMNKQVHNTIVWVKRKELHLKFSFRRESTGKPK